MKEPIVVIVTGPTGSGKSLWVGRCFQHDKGGRLQADSVSTVEDVDQLREHLKYRLEASDSSDPDDAWEFLFVEVWHFEKENREELIETLRSLCDELGILHSTKRCTEETTKQLLGL